jgi:hypothetical protein
MEIKKIFLILVDISGYTRFIKLHKISLIHAERIIVELLESVINVSTHPLILHELEGDAVSFYAVSDGSREMAQDISRQVLQFFEAFQARERELVSECSLCVCEACRNVGQLRLKAVLNHGEAVFTTVKHFTKVAGEDVILAHRLLKNSIKHDEYILLSESFYELSGGLDGQEPERRSEKYEGLGTVNVLVYYPEREATDMEPKKRSFWDKLKMSVKVDSYLVKRLLRKSSKRYQHLD